MIVSVPLPMVVYFASASRLTYCRECFVLRLHAGQGCTRLCPQEVFRDRRRDALVMDSGLAVHPGV